MEKPKIEDFYDVSDPRGMSTSEWDEYQKAILEWKNSNSHIDTSNYKSTIEDFAKLKGQFVIIDKKVLRLIAVAEDGEDYLYVMWNGKTVSCFTILDRITQLKGCIEEEHYNEWVRTAKLNDYFFVFKDKLPELKLEEKIEKDFRCNLLSEICYEIN